MTNKQCDEGRENKASDNDQWWEGSMVKAAQEKRWHEELFSGFKEQAKNGPPKERNWSL